MFPPIGAKTNGFVQRANRFSPKDEVSSQTRPVCLILRPYLFSKQWRISLIGWRKIYLSYCQLTCCVVRVSGWKHILLVIMLFSVVLPAQYVATVGDSRTHISSDRVGQTDVAETYTPHGPITINGNDDFASQGWPGSGTESEPYIIEGLNITDTATCIYIRDTDVHFEIRDCLISSPTSSSNHGISFSNVTHGTVRSSIVEMHQTGVFLASCVGCAVIDNSIHDNSDGICDTASTNTLIQLNSITNSGHYGIYEHNSLSSTIVENHVEDTALGAIRVEFSNYTTIRDNELDGQGWDGIRLCIGATNQLVEGNTIRNSGWNGICSENPHTIIRNNTISETTWCGIRLVGAPNNTVESNHISFSDELGIRIEDSESSTITGNTITNSSSCGVENWSSNVSITNNRVYNSTFPGIRTTHTSNTSIVGNFVEDTREYGVEVWATTGVYVADNTLIRTGGIVIQKNSHGAHVSGNILEDTFWTGLRAQESKDCIFEYNELNGVVEDGILIHDFSDHALVRENLFNVAGWQGLSVFNSSDCIFMDNQAQHIGDNGILVLKAPNTTVHGNRISDVAASGIALDMSDGSQIVKNNISTTANHGITVMSTEYIELLENIIDDVSVRGIDLESCREIVVRGNAVNRSQTYDISLESSSDCLISLNAFLTGDDSGARVFLSSDIQWDNSTHGNYWAQYEGVDSDGDGIGDTPYEINSGNVDHYPLVLLSFFDVLSRPDHIELSVVSMTTSPESPEPTDSVVVSVGMNHPNLVWKVVIAYSPDDGDSWTNSTANRTADYWVAEIPPQAPGTVVRYKAFICDIYEDWAVTSEDSYGVAGSDILGSVDPMVLSVAIIGIALIGAGYMVHRGRKMRKYEDYEEFFD